jgi:hypothetical protein
MKPARRKRGIFNLPAMRRREIERHAKDVGAHDLQRWLIAWVWHNDQNQRDRIGALQMAAVRMGNGRLAEAEATEILASADDMRRHRSADRLARFLGVTYAQRQRLGITTIGAIDVSRKGRMMLSKRKDRDRKRRTRGTKPRAEYEAHSLTRTKPWQAAGMSRRTWYRRRRETEALAAMLVAPPPEEQH